MIILKKTFLFIAVLSLLLLTFTSLSFAAPQPVKVFFEGEELKLTKAPTLIKEEPFFSIKPLFESLGYKVAFNTTTKTFTITTENEKLTIPVSGKGVIYNSKKVDLQQALTLIKDDYLISAQSFGKIFDLIVEYDKNASTINLYSSKYSKYVVALDRLKIADNITLVGNKIDLACAEYDKLSAEGANTSGVIKSFNEIHKLLEVNKIEIQKLGAADNDIKKINDYLVGWYNAMQEVVQGLSKGIETNDSKLIDESSIKAEQGNTLIEKWENALNEHL